MFPSSDAGPAPHVAIVGSGPSGCYVAQMLRKKWPAAQITIFDRLPVPFGLLRYGVAPDHQHTKRLAHQFGRVLHDAGTTFAGNVEVGVTVTMEELRRHYHVVVIAAGLAVDRPLGVPGNDLEGVHGAGQIMRWVNAHPDEELFAPVLGERAVVVGNGNVAVDVVRMLIKDETHFDGSDIHDGALDVIGAARPREIHVVGRSPAAAGKFDPAMIRELGDVEGVAFRVLPTIAQDHSSDAGPKVEALCSLPDRSTDDVRTTVTFHFGWTPREVLGSGTVAGVSFSDTGGRGETLELAADCVITAIGFLPDPLGPLGAYAGEESADQLDRVRLGDGIYACGWFRRGASGAIATNRSCAKEVVERIVNDVDPTCLPPRAGFEGLPSDVRAHAVDLEGWQRIDEFELRVAGGSRIRRKISGHSALLRTAQGAARLEEQQPVLCEQAGNTTEGSAL